MCSVKVHVFRYNCGMFSHTSYVHDQNSITYDMIVTPEMCRLASKSKKIKITAFDENFYVPIEFDTKTHQLSMMAKLLARKLNVLAAKSNTTLLKR